MRFTSRGIALPSTMMFDFPSVKLLSEFIETSMRETHEKAQAGKDAGAGGGGGQVGVVESGCGFPKKLCKGLSSKQFVQRSASNLSAAGDTWFETPGVLLPCSLSSRSREIKKPSASILNKGVGLDHPQEMSSCSQDGALFPSPNPQTKLLPGKAPR